MSEPCRHERAAGEIPGWAQALTRIEHERDAAVATIERVRAIVDDPHAALVVDRIRAILKPSS